MSLSDLELVLLCQQGQKQYFGDLYDRYLEKIYRFHFFKVGSKELAEDLTSQTFFKALEKITSFSNEKGNFNTWIYQIARNLSIDFFRSDKKNLDLEELPEISNNKDTQKETDHKILLEKINFFLKDCSPEQQEIIKLRIWEDLSYAEISEITGFSEGKLKMTISRLLKKIQIELGSSLISLFIFFTIWIIK